MRIVLAAAGQPDRPFEIDPALVEAHYGDWEGLTLADIGATISGSGKSARGRQMGSCPAARRELFHAVGARRRLAEDARSAPAFVVAHGGILRALIHQLAGSPPHDAPHLAVPQDRAILFTRRQVLTI